MLAKVYSAGLFGIDAYPIEIEVDISGGLPAITLVGMADTCIRESRERVKSAIKNSGFDWPQGRITVSLAPSNIKKEGACFDLPIALGILFASQQLNSQILADCCLLGELSLDGTLRPVQGILPISIHLSKSKIKNLLLPWQNAKEAGITKDIFVRPIKTLREAVEFLNNPEIIPSFKLDIENLFKQNSSYNVDFSEVRGQYSAKRAIEIAAAGKHNILMIGPPGSGKTMLAKRIPTIMPDLTPEEACEITKIHSVMGLLAVNQGLIAKRPFRSPHQSISNAALTGGGSLPMPGEISLAHHGILFLDELPEFRRDCLEAMRQPLEDATVRICRVIKSLTFPADFMLVCAMNPCPCGSLGQTKSICRCAANQVYKYRSKISGPLLDRINIHIEIPAAKYQELSSNLPAESSSQIKERVNNARVIQKDRFSAKIIGGSAANCGGSNENIFYNAKMSHKQVRKFCCLGKEESELLKTAMSELNFSARAYDKILKVSRTIADLAGSQDIKTEHLSEAVQYRSLDRGFF